MTTRQWAVGPTTFALAQDHRHLVVHPTPDCSVTIDSAGVAMLLHTAITHTACAAPGRHARYGTRLIGLHPTDPNWTDHPAGSAPLSGPLELYVLLPDDDIHILYRDEHLALLRDTLADVLRLMT